MSTTTTTDELSALGHLSRTAFHGVLASQLLLVFSYMSPKRALPLLSEDRGRAAMHFVYYLTRRYPLSAFCLCPLSMLTPKPVVPA
jgi:hypothetical protein